MIRGDDHAAAVEAIVALAGRGASVVVSDINPSSAEETAALIRSEGVRAEVMDGGLLTSHQDFPVLNATAGGGGKGMRVAGDEKELRANLEAAKNEAFAEILKSQRAFRADYAYWKSLAYLPRDF